jgi:YVTN family beta-propeller protein
MRLIAALLVLVSFSYGQWVVTTVQLSDSLAGLDSIRSIQFHAPNHTVYVGGDSTLVAVDAGTHWTLARTNLPGSPNMLCGSTESNKLYCASMGRESVWVIDCATNRFVTTVRLQGQVHEMCYAAALNKVYVASPLDNWVNVIDCETDSVVARIDVPSWPSALCYNPELNRIYVAKQTSDEVALIDCAADTVIRTVWVRGVKPTAIGYDSTTNCVYTLNYTSGTSSVIDCAGDSLIRVVTVGTKPDRILVGSAGRVYCGGYYDSVVTVVESQGTRTIPVGRHLSSMSFDPVNNKVYCATSDSDVVVVDAIEDTLVARVRVGEDLRLVCYDPVDTSTWAASTSEGTVGVIDGATDQLTDSLWSGIFYPGALCYNPLNNRLYCLGQVKNQVSSQLVVIDGDSNRLLKTVPVDSSADSMVWNPANNKIYLSNSADNTVSILDCASDSIAVTVGTGEWPGAMCCSDDGKVYVTTNAGGVAVIDPSGDSIRAFVPTPYDPRTLCYDRTDNKMYAGLRSVNQVSVIDVDGDSVVATVPVAESCEKVCWNPNHNKVYVCGRNGDLVPVIDCASDTVLKNMIVSDWLWTSYSDSACDRIYFADVNQGYLFIADAARDRLYLGPHLGIVRGMLDNGQPGAANRLYCTSISEGRLTVISGATDSILRVIQVGVQPTTLAWNPVHSWVYVSNSGSSSITVVSDTMLGIEESQPQASSRKPQATVVRGVLFVGDRPRMGTVPKAVLLDAAGRKVLDLHPGANDVRMLAPGVYFVRAVSRKPSAVSCSKVVVAR